MIYQKQSRLPNIIQRSIIFYMLIACAHLSYQMSMPDSPYYTAAVVEYPPRYSKNNNETLDLNSEVYVQLIKKASSNNADIIVFPEMGLTTVDLPDRTEMQNWATIIPDVPSNCTPCDENTFEVGKTLKRISCAARNYNIYVVINIAEKLPCTERLCPHDKMFYYNSNVAFDRRGKIIARYRKTNLYVEPQFNVTKVPEVITFDTDFGVKFGTFICFDILFQVPALTLTRIHNVTDIAFPTAWFSEMPFLTAVQTQAAWSYAENVNLLAAGYNRPEFGNTGSGIYLGRKGIGEAILSKTREEDVLIVQVPKIKEKTIENHRHDHSMDQNVGRYDHEKERAHNELHTKRYNLTDTIFLKHENIEKYETSPLKGNVTKTVCQNGFCCDFKVEVTTMDSSTKYRLAVFNGIRRYSYIEAKIRVCGIIQCSNNSVSSCGSLEKSRTVFSNIEIMATYNDYKNRLIMPSTLGSDVLPLKGWKYDEHTHGDHIHVSMYLDIKTNDLATFGLFSRYFERNSASKTSFDILTYIIMLSVSLLLFTF